MCGKTIDSAVGT